MKISQVVTKAVHEEFELETPAFFKGKYGAAAAIYSEDHVVSVTKLSCGWVNITKGTVKEFIDLADTLASPRITEDEFREMFDNAMNSVSAVLMVGPQLQTA